MNLFANRRRLLTVTGVAGIGYALSWIAGLSVGAPSPKLTASADQIAAALAGHQAAVAAQFTLTEGLPAAGLAIVSIALARAARRSGAAAAGRAALLAGGMAALISLAQFVLGAVLAATSAPGTAHLLYDVVNRLDGVKMLTLAVLGVAAASSGVLLRWLRYTGTALAVAITASGIAYLLLLQGLASLAVPAGVLLLVFITGTGITLGTSAGSRGQEAPNKNRELSMSGSSSHTRRRGPTAADDKGHRLTRLLGTGVAGLIAVYLVGRGILELFVINYSSQATYQNDWGGPSLTGVLAVHSGPALAIMIGAAIYLRRRWHGAAR